MRETTTRSRTRKLRYCKYGTRRVLSKMFRRWYTRAQERELYWIRRKQIWICARGDCANYPCSRHLFSISSMLFTGMCSKPYTSAREDACLQVFATTAGTSSHATSTPFATCLMNSALARTLRVSCAPSTRRSRPWWTMVYSSP